MDIYEQLCKPFPAEDISWRIGSTTKDKTKGLALAYIDARDVMRRLDEVVGWNNWGTIDSKQGDTYYCQLTIEYPTGFVCGDKKVAALPSGTVTKTGAAGATAVEGEKGGASDAFKRAGVLFGIGRYLYDLNCPWVELEEAGRGHKIKKSEYKKLRDLLEGSSKTWFQEGQSEYFQQKKEALITAPDTATLDKVNTEIKDNLKHLTNEETTELRKLSTERKNLLQTGEGS